MAKQTKMERSMEELEEACKVLQLATVGISGEGVERLRTMRRRNYGTAIDENLTFEEQRRCEFMKWGLTQGLYSDKED